jgi:hypothetical protein
MHSLTLWQTFPHKFTRAHTYAHAQSCRNIHSELTPADTNTPAQTTTDSDAHTNTDTTHARTIHIYPHI